MIVDTRRRPRAAHLPRRPRALALLGLAVLLASCATGPVANSHPATPTPTHLPQGTPLFQADWSHGLADWQPTPGWQVVDGAAQSDTGDNSSLTVPYRPVTPFYAVEYHVQVANVPENGGYFILSAPQAAGSDGYSADILDLQTSARHPQGAYSNETVRIVPSDSQDPTKAHINDYIPGTDLHTYRVEVDGPTVKFLIDGNTGSIAVSIKTATLSTGPLRFETRRAVVRLVSLTITAL